MSDKQDNKITIEVDGVPLEATPGQMLIEVTDRAGVYVPRFCYHRKLTVAANCRMCLVDVEKAPKPLPACATPVADGMKVFTRSNRAVSAQKATMEFLLINHPLDCPICDQGGECELQDLAVGFGRGVSRYTEGKRVVKDKNLGPLVSTDMTRCIHCTRCVRFGQEIAGIQELGTIGRSEDMKISTFIEKSVDHELSGNIIDVCPVGALNNKPYRFAARAWEMAARPLIAPHDCAGSNVYGHVLRGKLRRVVPGDNDAVNETWISDRDRFGCFGLYAEDRLETPMIRRDQDWQEVSWQEALEFACESIRSAVADEGEALGVLASPSATLEELYLLRRIASHLGSLNIDHRLRRLDFRDQQNDAPWPWLGTSIADIEKLDGILLVGSNIRMEVPILAHRIRKAALKGAAVGFVAPEDYVCHYSRAANVVAPVTKLVSALAGVLVAAAAETGKSLPASLASDLGGVEPDAEQKAAAQVLLAKRDGSDEGKSLVLIGQIAERHPQFSEIRALAAALAALTGATLGYLPEGSNGVGAALAGFLPHRGIGGKAVDDTGFDAHRMLASPRRAYMLFGIEPDRDLAEGGLAADALKSADIVVAFSSFASESLLETADVLLPVSAFSETEGTYVNAEGRWQTFASLATPPGETRPGWRVLRVLGNDFGVERCDYTSAADVRAGLEAELTESPPDTRYAGTVDIHLEGVTCSLETLDVPIYSIDPLVRRSAPLQLTRIARARTGVGSVGEAASA